MSGSWRAPSRLWIVIPLGLLLATLAFLGLRSPTEPMSAERSAQLPSAEAQALARCRTGSEAAGAAATCQAVWLSARRRFLGTRP